MHILKQCFLILLMLGAWPAQAQTVQVERPLADPQMEAQAQVLFSEIRCVVCAGQSLTASNAPLAQDMRMQVRQQLQNGLSPNEVRQFFVERYGEEILQRPPVTLRTLALWLGPLLMMALGAWFYIRYFASQSSDKKVKAA